MWIDIENLLKVVIEYELPYLKHLVDQTDF